MKIVKFNAENFKRLKAVEITPEGNIVEITGRNGQGKTSVLDAIWAVIAGAEHIQAEPIRKGQTKARIRLNLGTVSVERRFTEKGSSLIVEDEKGARYTQPQTFLNELFGELSFDPLAFVRMKPQEQYEELRRVAPIEIDLEKLDALNNADYHKRTEINRDAKSARVQAEALTVPEGLPEAKIDVAELLAEMETASTTNSDIERRRANRERAAAEVARKREDAARVRSTGESGPDRDITEAEFEHREAKAKAHRELDRAIKEADDRLASVKKRAEEERARAQAGAQKLEEEASVTENELKAAGELPAAVDVADLCKRVQEAQVINHGITVREHRLQLIAAAEGFELASKNLTESIEARTAEKTKAIAAAKMPVEGLGFGESLVTFNGVPFEQASGAEQIRVSLAIAMALNPKLRVIRLQHGNDLDTESFKLIAALAKAQDYQVWIEAVDETGKRGIVIEDGGVVAVNKK